MDSLPTVPSASSLTLEHCTFSEGTFKVDIWLVIHFDQFSYTTKSSTVGL